MCPEAVYKARGQGSGMLEALQKAPGPCRQGCDPCHPSSVPARERAEMGKAPAVLTGLPLDILFLTLLPPFHLGLRQRCKASFPETVPPASS